MAVDGRFFGLKSMVEFLLEKEPFVFVGLKPFDLTEPFRPKVDLTLPDLGAALLVISAQYVEPPHE